MPCAAARARPDGCRGPGRPPEVGVQDDAGRVHDGHEAGCARARRGEGRAHPRGRRRSPEPCRPRGVHVPPLRPLAPSRRPRRDRARRGVGRAAASTRSTLGGCGDRSADMRGRYTGWSFASAPSTRGARSGLIGRQPGRPRPGRADPVVAGQAEQVPNPTARSGSAACAGGEQRPPSALRVRRETRGSGRRARPHRRAPSYSRRYPT